MLPKKKRKKSGVLSQPTTTKRLAEHSMQAAHNGRKWTETFISLLYRQKHFRKGTQPGAVRPAGAAISRSTDADSCGLTP